MKLNKPKVKMKRNQVKQLENIVAHLLWYKSQYDGAYDRDYIYGQDNPNEINNLVWQIERG